MQNFFAVVVFTISGSPSGVKKCANICKYNKYKPHTQYHAYAAILVEHIVANLSIKLLLALADEGYFFYKVARHMFHMV